MRDRRVRWGRNALRAVCLRERKITFASLQGLFCRVGRAREKEREKEEVSSAQGREGVGLVCVRVRVSVCLFVCLSRERLE